MSEAFTAFDEFTGCLDPDSSVDANSAAYALAAAEWVVFDWRPEGNPDKDDPRIIVDEHSEPLGMVDGEDRPMTPLEYVVRHPPHPAGDIGFSPDELDRYADVARTQVTSLFWVRGVAAAKDQVTLEDLHDGRLYVLHDRRLVDFLKSSGSNVGLLGMRIARSAISRPPKPAWPDGAGPATGTQAGGLPAEAGALTTPDRPLNPRPQWSTAGPFARCASGRLFLRVTSVRKHCRFSD